MKNATEREIFLFRQNPIQTLRNIGVSLVNRISPRRLARLSNYIRTIIDKIKSAFKEWKNCAACKIALKLVFLAFATLINIPLIEIINHLDFVQLLSEFFEQRINEMTTFLKQIGITVGEYNFFEINDLIEKLCAKFGYC